MAYTLKVNALRHPPFIPLNNDMNVSLFNEHSSPATDRCHVRLLRRGARRHSHRTAHVQTAALLDGK